MGILCEARRISKGLWSMDRSANQTFTLVVRNSLVRRILTSLWSPVLTVFCKLELKTEAVIEIGSQMAIQIFEIQYNGVQSYI